MTDKNVSHFQHMYPVYVLSLVSEGTSTQFGLVGARAYLHVISPSPIFHGSSMTSIQM
jgi:hypothetical protein